MPHALMMSHGLPLKEAQALVSSKLKVYHPYGTIGRLPWQSGEAADVEWGTDQPWNILNLAKQIRTSSEALRDMEGLRTLRAMVSNAKRLVFLGFGFHPQNIDLIIDYALSHEPEILMTAYDMSESNMISVKKMLHRKAGSDDEDLLMATTGKCFELMRDNSILLES